MLADSCTFTQETIWNQWKRWIILTIMSIIVPFILGYVMEIYRGGKTPVEPENYVKLFIDGLKLIFVGIIYFIPICLIMLISFYPVIMQMVTGILNGEEITLSVADLVPFLPQILGGMLLAVILGIVIILISSLGVVRMAKMDSISEAFNFSGILETIKGIGWGSYILALIVLFVIITIISLVFSLVDYIPFIGTLLTFILGVPLTIFEARYITLLYESSESHISESGY